MIDGVSHQKHNEGSECETPHSLSKDSAALDAPQNGTHRSLCLAGCNGIACNYKAIIVAQSFGQFFVHVGAQQFAADPCRHIFLYKRGAKRSAVVGPLHQRRQPLSHQRSPRSRSSMGIHTSPWRSAWRKRTSAA